MKPEIFADTVLVWLGPVPLTRTVASSVVVSALLVLLGASLARAVRRHPEGRAAAAGRLAFGFIHDLVEQAAGRPWPALEVFAGTLFLFIATAAVVGQLPGVPAPTANLPASAALAALVFGAVPLAGIRARGVGGYLAHYLKPNPILFPLHVISELSRTLALALRLFGNMMSGHLVVALIVALVGFFVPVPLMALDLLIGLLQAYIFTILTAVYVGAAARVGEQS
ncbi:MAG: F0F1 ATP synthase subunit A [Deltaproteobacteria bacterium]|nr:F0F1 ATP synthase subunit A [Deltaproteobacteria bacterium]